MMLIMTSRRTSYPRALSDEGSTARREEGKKRAVLSEDGDKNNEEES